MRFSSERGNRREMVIPAPFSPLSTGRFNRLAAGTPMAGIGSLRWVSRASFSPLDG